jgi:hypothetical protein
LRELIDTLHPAQGAVTIKKDTIKGGGHRL